MVDLKELLEYFFKMFLLLFLFSFHLFSFYCSIGFFFLSADPSYFSIVFLQDAYFFTAFLNCYLCIKAKSASFSSESEFSGRGAAEA
jgi:hypothetical protein